MTTVKVKGNARPQFRLRNTRQNGRKSGNPTLTEVLKPTTDDIKLLLAAQSHIGRRVSNTNMKRYIWKRRKDGINIINLEKTWNKIQLAARIFCAIKNPEDVMVMSSRTFGQRGAIKFAHYTNASTLLGKWTPGTFCNPQNKDYKEPRLLIVDDPMTCFAALRETSYIGVPVIAFCGIDNNTRFVDCAIPCNNRGRLSIGLIFWLLAREILRMKNIIKRTTKWDASVDLFFYRDPDEIKKDQEAKLRALENNKMQNQPMPDDPLNQYPPQDNMGQDNQNYNDQQYQQDYQQPPVQQNLTGWNNEPQEQQFQQPQQQFDNQQQDNQGQQQDNQGQQQYQDDNMDQQQQQQQDFQQDNQDNQNQQPQQQQDNQGQGNYEVQDW